jgi:hypothetical protein
MGGMMKKKPPPSAKSGNRCGDDGSGKCGGAFILDVSLFTDGYPEETYHYLYDVDDDFLLFAYDEFDSYSFYSEIWELDPDGCYQYHIYDTWGGGMEEGYGAFVMIDGSEAYAGGNSGEGGFISMGCSGCA